MNIVVLTGFASIATAVEAIKLGAYDYLTKPIDDLRLKLMEVYGQQGDRDAFVGQERQLVANGDNFAKVEELKKRFPAMAVVAVAGLAAAAPACADAVGRQHDRARDCFPVP